MAGRATQERTLGAILGMGIGDALGMPVAGKSRQQIERELGRLDRYHPKTFADGSELKAGEFTDETEIALCIMETYTSAAGQLDQELIRARMQFLARGESRRWMSAETLKSLDDPEDSYRSDDDTDPEVALRGVTIGLIHAGRVLDVDALRRDVETVVGLTHRNPHAIDQAVIVATAVGRTLARVDDGVMLFDSLSRVPSNPILAAAIAQAEDRIGRRPTGADVLDATDSGNAAVDVIVSGIAAFSIAERFEDAVFIAARAGGAADSRAALAGALAGANAGAGGIPQRLIDDLEGRIYLTLAAPWFYRTIQMMSGGGLRMEPNGA